MDDYKFSGTEDAGSDRRRKSQLHAAHANLQTTGLCGAYGLAGIDGRAGRERDCAGRGVAGNCDDTHNGRVLGHNGHASKASVEDRQPDRLDIIYWFILK